MKLSPYIIFIIFGVALVIFPDIWEIMMKASNSARGLDTSQNNSLKTTGRIIGVLLIIVGIFFTFITP